MVQLNIGTYLGLRTRARTGPSLSNWVDWIVTKSFFMVLPAIEKPVFLVNKTIRSPGWNCGRGCFYAHARTNS